MSAKAKKKKKSTRSSSAKPRGKAKARQRAQRGASHGNTALAWPEDTGLAAADPSVDQAALEAGAGNSTGVAVGETQPRRKRETRQAALAARQTRDGLRWIGVGLLVLAGIVANFYFGEASLLYRMLGMVAVGVLAAPLALGTTGGIAFSQLLRESRLELRKVVWPTRTEVIQTTLLVLAFVLLVALILWGLDAALGWVVANWIG